MSENGRYNYINSVVNSFATIMAAHRGEVVCEVTTAKVSLCKQSLSCFLLLTTLF